MGVYARAMVVCKILAQVYPGGITRGDLFKKAHENDPERFPLINYVDFALGIAGGREDNEDRAIACWRREGERFFYDPTAKNYAPNEEKHGFATEFTKWLDDEGLSNLVIIRPATPDNSTVCPMGFKWRTIVFPMHCSWDYIKRECDPEACKF